MRRVLLFLTLAVAVTCVLLWRSAPPDDVTLAFLDVGQGDASAILTPSGEVVLIDGGPDDRILEELGAVLPLRERTIDLAVLTHSHADHLRGLLPVLERYDVRTILSAPTGNDGSDLMDAFTAAVRTEGASVVSARAGQTLTFPDVTLRVLAPIDDLSTTMPDDLNNASVVLELVSQNGRALFTGDAGIAVETALREADSLSPVTVLKVGHHGSATSTGAAFLAVVRPAVAVISVGEGNTYGHPAEETLVRLGAGGISVYRTDLQGRITIRFADTGVLVHPTRMRE